MTWAEKNNTTLGQASVALSFGALVDPVAAQLKAQGLTTDNAPVERWQKICSALVTLHLNGYVSDSQVQTIRRRIIRAVGKHYSMTHPAPMTQSPTTTPRET